MLCSLELVQQGHNDISSTSEDDSLSHGSSKHGSTDDSDTDRPYGESKSMDSCIVMTVSEATLREKSQGSGYNLQICLEKSRKKKNTK
jgi:hypothetical protein